MEIFRYLPGTALARGYPVGSEFVVLKGSTALREGTANEKRDRALRDELVRQGVLIADDAPELYRFTRDYRFNSPSQAGGVVKDGNCSGPQVWLHEENGTSLRDWTVSSKGLRSESALTIITIPYRLPPSPTEGNPFGKGFEKPSAAFLRQRLRPGDLKERIASRQPRTIYFRDQLAVLFRILGGPVPYIFIDGDGLYRRLDAGCLGFLHFGEPREIEFQRDSDGRIIAAIPVEGSELDPDPGPLRFDLTKKPDEALKRRSKQTIRIGAKEFRAMLIRNWDGRCAVTGTSDVGALDAAHIYRYCDETTNHPCNGLLLRADIHRLFDRHLIAFEYRDGSLFVCVSDALTDPQYVALRDKEITLPRDPRRHPDPELIRHHFEVFGRKSHRSGGKIAVKP